MPPGSILARALGRVAGKRVRGNKYFSAGVVAAHTTARHTARVTRILFLEVAGFFFAVTAVVLAGSAHKHYRAYALGAEPRQRFLVAAAFSILFAYFALTSFMRARKHGDPV